MEAIHVIVDIFSFLSNAITVLVGGIALYGIFTHPNEIKSLLLMLKTSHLHERVKRVKESLGKLEALSYNVKEDRPEIFALLGQISGQVKLFSQDLPMLTPTYNEIMLIIEKKSRLDEAAKRRILYELHAALDRTSDAASESIVQVKK